MATFSAASICRVVSVRSSSQAANSPANSGAAWPQLPPQFAVDPNGPSSAFSPLSLSLSSSAVAPSANAALDPSASYANIMWAAASKVFNTQILVGETESTESVVRRFKKVCMEANIVQECRRRRYFETKQDIIKRKQKDAARTRKRFSRSGGPRSNMFAMAKDKPQEKGAAASADDNDEAEWDAMSL